MRGAGIATVAAVVGVAVEIHASAATAGLCVRAALPASPAVACVCHSTHAQTPAATAAATATATATADSASASADARVYGAIPKPPPHRHGCHAR